MNLGTRNTPFYRRLTEAIAALGGMHNAHLHLDRYGTLDDRYLAGVGHRTLATSHVSLKKKHGLIHALHEGPAYEPADLRRRVGEALDAMVACGTRRADTLVDCTADRVGLSALELLQDVQRERRGAIDLRLGAYSPLGFRDDRPERWRVFEAGARAADFLAALPEADEVDDYPAHIGFEEHCRRMVALARELGKPLHVHTDQRNEPGERGTERLLEVLREVGGLAPEHVGQRADEPAVWAVHAISPTTYDDARFDALVQGLVEQRVGVIVCPSAALGMRQLRPLLTPTQNSMPRVLELCAGGVFVRLASDNVADICSPSTTADLVDEVFVLSAAIRYYGVEVLARLAAGQRLSAQELDAVREHLVHNEAEIAKALDARVDQAAP